MDAQTEPYLTATAVWRISVAVVRALDAVLSDPHDSYVNGSQVWLDDEGPSGVTIEWRLHPVAGFLRPPGTTTAGLFRSTLRSTDPPSDRMHTDDLNADDPPLAVAMLWDGLEAFPAYGDPVDADDLARWAAHRLGIPPDVHGIVDHERIAVAWEHAQRNRSIVADLLDQLEVV